MLHEHFSFKRLKFETVFLNMGNRQRSTKKKSVSNTFYLGISHYEKNFGSEHMAYGSSVNEL